MARLALFGGSFDPIHNGHLAVARQVVGRFDVEKLWFIPASISPLKRGLMTASDKDRLAMLRLAIGDDPRFDIDDSELVRGGVSYTVDTLRRWHERYPSYELIFVVGMDSLLTLSRWKDYEEIVRLCRFVTYLRSGCDLKPSIEDLSLPTEIATRLLDDVFEGELVDVSSTEIRQRAIANEDISLLVPKEVADFILENKVYIRG